MLHPLRSQCVHKGLVRCRSRWNLLGYRHYGDDVVDRFVERARRNGFDVLRVFDAMTDPRNLERAIKAVRDVGGHAQDTTSYTVSPVHPLDSWIELAETIADMGADSLAIKDMAGLLAPTTPVSWSRG